MIMPLVVAKFFSAELFGSYSLAKMIVFFFTTLLIASAQTPFVVFANQERAETGKINKSFSVQCLVLFTSVLLFIVLSLLFSKQILAFAKISYADLFFLILAFFGLVTKSFLCNLFLALGLRLRNALAELVFGGSACLLVFLIYFVGRLTLKSVFLIYLVSGLVTLLLLIRGIGWGQLCPFVFSVQHAKKMLDFTKWLVLGSIAVYFINWGDNLVLRLYRPMNDIGMYNLAYQVFKGLITLTGVLATYFLPFISEHAGNPKKLRDYLHRKRLRILIPGAVAIASLFFLLPVALRVIYGNTYEDSIVVIQILLLGLVLALYNTLYKPVLHALKKYRFLQALNINQVLLNLALDFLLVPRMGIAGAAVATSLSYLFRSAVLELYFRTKLKYLIKDDKCNNTGI